MKVVRRRFLKWSLLGSVAASLPTEGLAESETSFETDFRADRLSILQGGTDETHTQFSVLHKRKQDLTFHVTDQNGEMILPDRVDFIDYKSHKQMLSKVFFSNLSLGKKYKLVVMEEGKEVVDVRNFKMLSGDLDKLEFSIASCMDDRRHEPKIWKDMVKHRPDFILFVGDSVYADKKRSTGDERAAADPFQLWDRFCDARRTLEIFHSKDLIPIFATWDDHDFGANDTGSSYPFVEESQQNFLNFFAQNESHCRMLTSGPGVSSALKIGNQLFLLLDDRSFREDGKSKKRFAHWGQEQEQWALDMIDLHDEDGFVWIVNGTQLFPAMIFKESVIGDHFNNLKGFTQEIARRGRKAAFISGDVHFSELSLIEDDWLGYDTIEITSSSIHSKAVPGVPGIVPNKRRIVGTGQRNYVEVKAKMEFGDMSMKIKSRSKKERINFKREFTI